MVRSRVGKIVRPRLLSRLRQGHKLWLRRLTGSTLEQRAPFASLAVGELFWRVKHHRAAQQQLNQAFLSTAVHI